MHAALPVRVCLAMLACLAATAQAQTMKPGLWEMSSRISGDARMDAALAQMQEKLASMPPEQRKLVEDMLARQGMKVGSAGAGAGGLSAQVCITPEMAARYELPLQQRGNCTTTTSDRTASGMKIAIRCENPASTGEGEASFPDADTYSMKMRIQTPVGGQSQTVLVDSSGKWLGADCGSIKPRTSAGARVP